MEEEKVSLWKLFCATFTLSAFTFGGGYVIISLMKDRFVDKYHWLEENEMLDMVSIAQSAPGPIAVNHHGLQTARHSWCLGNDVWHSIATVFNHLRGILVLRCLCG
mgnify:CR=1 FL=1